MHTGQPFMLGHSKHEPTPRRQRGIQGHGGSSPFGRRRANGAEHVAPSVCPVARNGTLEGMTNTPPRREEEGDVATETRKKVQQPPLYKVLLHNDDFTTQE